MKNGTNYSTPLLADYKGDVKKRWFIYFDYTDDLSGIKKRKQFSHGINYIHEKQARYVYGHNLIEFYKKKLAEGWNPITGKKEDPDDKPQSTNVIESINFIVDIKKTVARIKTVQGYTWATKLFSTWLKDNHLQYETAQSFSPKNAQAFMDYLVVNKKFKGKSHNNVLIYMRSFFNSMQDREMITKNPFRLCKKMPVETGKNVTFDDAEITKLDAHIKARNIRLWYFKEFMYCAAIRRTELTLLRVRDILDNSIVMHSGTSKNKKQESVSINQRLKAVIEQMQLDKCDPNHFVFGRSLKTSDQQFMNPNHISSLHLKLSREIGIRKECTLYSWKHTGAAKLYLLTKDPYKVMRHLRHHSLEMTMIYLRSLGFNADESIQGMTW